MSSLFCYNDSIERMSSVSYTHLDEIKHKVLKEEINTKLRAINPNYYTVMQIEHSFI